MTLATTNSRNRRPRMNLSSLALNSSRDNTPAVVANGHVPTQLADSGLIAKTPNNDKVTFNDIHEFFEVKVEGWNSTIGKFTTIIPP